jgi:hypothetical protein
MCLASPMRLSPLWICHSRQKELTIFFLDRPRALELSLKAANVGASAGNTVGGGTSQTVDILDLIPSLLYSDIPVEVMQKYRW